MFMAAVDGIKSKPKGLFSSKHECTEMRDIAVDTYNVGIMTEPDGLGPCEPGTSVVLEGIVWQETENGLLVVNVTWRGKTYVGTLLDASKHEWSPPSFRSESPNDPESRTPGRGGRGRRGRTTMNSQGARGRSGRSFAVPSSPAKSDNGKDSNKRRHSSIGDPDLIGPGPAKRTRSGATTPSSETNSNGNSNEDTFFECSECDKRYRNLNGLKYHQNHAHKEMVMKQEGNVVEVQVNKGNFYPKVKEEPKESESSKQNTPMEVDKPLSKKEKKKKKKENSKKNKKKNAAEQLRAEQASQQNESSKSESVSESQNVDHSDSDVKSVTLCGKQPMVQLTPLSVPTKTVTAPIANVPIGTQVQGSHTEGKHKKSKGEKSKHKNSSKHNTDNDNSNQSVGDNSVKGSQDTTGEPVKEKKDKKKKKKDKKEKQQSSLEACDKSSDSSKQRQQEAQKSGSASVVKSPPSIPKPSTDTKPPAAQVMPNNRPSAIVKTEPSQDAPQTGSTNSDSQNKDTANEFVQSPAYSDISDDGNESANSAPSTPAVDNDTDKKNTQNVNAPSSVHKVTTTPPSTAAAPVTVNTPPQFGPPPKLALIHPPSTQAPPTSVAPQVNHPHVSPPSFVQTPQKPKDIKAPISEQDIKKERPPVQGKVERPSHSNSPSQSDNRPGNPYRPGFPMGYPIDPNYHLQLMATNPQYRANHEKYIEEQKRKQQLEKFEAQKQNNEKTSQSVPPSNNEKTGIVVHRPEHMRHPGEQVRHPGDQAQKQHSPSVSVLKESHPKDKVDDKRTGSDNTLKERLSENQQILKENIELKSQMDEKQKHESQAALERQREYQLYYMYHQKRMLELQKRGEDGMGPKPSPSSSDKPMQHSPPIVIQHSPKPRSIEEHHARQPPPPLTSNPQKLEPSLSRSRSEADMKMEAMRRFEAEQRGVRPDDLRDRENREKAERDMREKAERDMREREIREREMRDRERSPHTVAPPKDSPSGPPPNRSSAPPGIPIQYSHFYSHPYGGHPLYGGMAPYGPYPGGPPFMQGGGPSPQGESKALEMLQHHASQYMSPPGRPQESKDRPPMEGRPKESPRVFDMSRGGHIERRTSSPAREQERRTPNTPSSSSSHGFERSTPPQRHPMVPPGYPQMYGGHPFGGLMGSPQGQQMVAKMTGTPK